MELVPRKQPVRRERSRDREARDWRRRDLFFRHVGSVVS